MVDLAQRLSALREQELTDRTLRAAQLDLIAERVPFDGHVFAMTDPSTQVITSPHATVPMVDPGDLPSLIRRRYAAGSLAQWHQVLAEFGVTDTVLVRCQDRWGTWGFLELWRCGRRFSDPERDQLAGVATVLTQLLKMALARTFTIPDRPAARPESGVILVDADLEVSAATSGAAQALLRLLPPTEPGPPVPAAAYNVVAALLAYEDGSWPNQPWARVHLGANRWAGIRADRLSDRIAVSIGAATPSERADLFSRANGLSARERQVLDLALHGLDTRAVATQLTIAVSTAEDHLKALLAKTGSASRHQLLARALGG